MRFAIIDAHAHCGRQDRYTRQDFEDYYTEVKGSDIVGVVMFPPVAEIYDRYDPDFEDTPDWQRTRQRANAYLLRLEGLGLEVFPYFFIWNDFAVDQLTDSHCGIKWHRHADEPRYHYEDPRCKGAIDEIRRRNMPVCLEEEWDRTLYFVNELAPDMKIIIPHCGLLNGGFDKFCGEGIWERPNIFTDTALAPSRVIADYVKHYGHTRIMYGSDFPFGDPVREYRKIMALDLNAGEKEAILRGNIQAVLSEVNQPAGDGAAFSQ
jgi:hypothetical protein